VDYKTDREIAAAGEERYRRQVALYASAIAQATGSRAAGILLRSEPYPSRRRRVLRTSTARPILPQSIQPTQ